MPPLGVKNRDRTNRHEPTGGPGSKKSGSSEGTATMPKAGTAISTTFGGIHGVELGLCAGMTMTAASLIMIVARANADVPA